LFALLISLPEIFPILEKQLHEEAVLTAMTI